MNEFINLIRKYIDEKEFNRMIHKYYFADLFEVKGISYVTLIDGESNVQFDVIFERVDNKVFIIDVRRV